MNAFFVFFVTVIAGNVLETSSAFNMLKSPNFVGAVITRASHNLRGHVLKSVPVPSQISCAQTCLMHPRCVSTNYGFSAGLCELNDRGVGETVEADRVLEYHKEFVYSEYRREVRIIMRLHLNFEYCS